MNTNQQMYPQTNFNNNEEIVNPKDEQMTNFQTVVDGYGPQYFNVRDPNFTQKNTPVKLGFSYHIPIIVFNIIFLFCLIFGAIGFDRLFGLEVFLPMAIISYFFYLCISCCYSDIKSYIENTKKYDAYQDTYDKMVQGKGYFSFYIECYHYISTGTGRQRRRRKVVTHTASQRFNFSESVDQSGQITNIDDVKNFVFLNYLQRYYFTDDRSQQIFNKSYTDFVASNRRDTYQSHSRTFHIQNFEQHVCYTALGESNKTRALFYIFTLLGLAFPYALIFENAVARYQVGILKRLTV